MIEIADHLPVFTFSYHPFLSPFPNTFKIRDFKRFDKNSFQDDLRSENWRSVYNSSDENESLSRFLHIFNRVSNKHAPLKTIKIKSNKPWVTVGLRKSIEVRNKLTKNGCHAAAFMGTINTKFTETKSLQLTNFTAHYTIINDNILQDSYMYIVPRKCGIMLI